jgi:hypothetical protein
MSFLSLAIAVILVIEIGLGPGVGLAFPILTACSPVKQFPAEPTQTPGQSSPSVSPSPDDAPDSSPSPQTTLPESVRDRVRQDLAQRRQISEDQVRILSFRPETWIDGCLGLPQPGEFCTQSLVEGWRVEATDGLGPWIYRTDQSGTNLRLESPQQPSTAPSPPTSPPSTPSPSAP